MIGPDLNKICGGHLQREFARLLPNVLEAAAETGKTAGVTLKVVVEPVQGEPGTPPAFQFTAVARSTLPTRRMGELYKWADGELSSGNTTMSLPFDEN